MAIVVAIDKLELLLGCWTECRSQLLRLLGDFDGAVADDDDDDELVGEDEDGATNTVTAAPPLELEAGIRRVAPPLIIILLSSFSFADIIIYVVLRNSEKQTNSQSIVLDHPSPVAWGDGKVRDPRLFLQQWSQPVAAL